MKLFETLSEKIWFPKLKIRNLEAELSAFKSGEKYVRMEKDFQKTPGQANRDVERMRREVAAAHSETAKVRDIWMDIYETAEKEYTGKIAALEKENRELREKLRQKVQDYYKIGAELEEEKEKNQKPSAQLHKDYENSSKPSSQKPAHKKIENNRGKTGKKRGAQPGHAHHPRPGHEPAEYVQIPPGQEFLDESKYRPAGRNATRQVLKLNVSVEVVEYSTPVFIEKATGKEKHACFPHGAENDVNYGGSVKAFLVPAQHGMQRFHPQDEGFPGKADNGEAFHLHRND